jgi:glycosyltransferase involved in cell wall biosynthesis
MKMKLTVIVISYNFENYIEDCLRSIVSQKTDFDFDIFIRDDNSTDNTREVIQKFVNNQEDSSRFKLFFEPLNLGIHKNLEVLISQTDSDYINHIDGDDYYIDPTKLQSDVDFLDQNHEYIMRTSGYVYHLPDGTNYPFNEGWWFAPVKKELSQMDIIDVNYVSGGRTFRNLGKKFNALWSNDYWCDFYHEDWFMNFFLLSFGKCFQYDGPQFCYRITGTGKLTGLSNDQLEKINTNCKEILKIEFARINNPEI